MLRRQTLASIIILAAAACVHAQSRDALEVQKARNKHVLDRAKKVYYTRKWNLDDLPQYRPEQQASGLIREWGDNYFGDSNLNDYWEEGFHKYHPDVKFEYHLKTTLTAIPGLYTGVADLAPSRKITFSDTLAFERFFNYDPLEIVVANGSFDVPGWSNALGIFVNKSNPISKVSMSQLDAIFGAARDGGWIGTSWHPEFARKASDNIRTWGQLGLTGEWKDKPIHVYGLNLRYHQSTFFSDLVLKGSDKWNEGLRMYANYSKADGTLAIAANELVQDLGKDPYGIAYSGIQNLTPETRVLPLSAKDGGPYVDLSIDNVRNRSYPLADEVYIYLNREPGKPVDPKLKEYLRYILSREGQDAITRDGKYLPLTAEQVREQLRKLD